MDIILDRVPQCKRGVLFRLLQYSLFEESLTDGNEMHEDALFDYPWFDAYFIEAHREAYFIRDAEQKRLLGFAMLREEGGVHSVAEFMVIPEYRRRGVGLRAAHLCFGMHGGRWTVSPSLGSEPAEHFWRRAIDAYTGGRFDWTDAQFEFET